MHNTKSDVALMNINCSFQNRGSSPYFGLSVFLPCQFLNFGHIHPHVLIKKVLIKIRLILNICILRTAFFYQTEWPFSAMPKNTQDKLQRGFRNRVVHAQHYILGKVALKNITREINYFHARFCAVSKIT